MNRAISITDFISGVWKKEPDTTMHIIKKESGLTQKTERAPLEWDKDIEELETFFNKITLPSAPVKLNRCTTIIDIPSFIDSHLAISKAHNGNRIFLPYLNELKKLKSILND